MHQVGSSFSKSRIMIFFFASGRRHTSWPRDWSSDVCSSVLKVERVFVHEAMHEDALDLVLLGHLKQREEMVDVRVHAAIAHEPQQVQLSRAPALHRLQKQ